MYNRARRQSDPLLAEFPERADRHALSFLFLGGTLPICEDAADVDDLGSIELTDAVYLLNHLFLGGAAPPAPYPAAGEDPTEDALGCRGF